MKKYVIYEIPGVKIGATTRWPKRVIEQGYEEKDCNVLFETDVLLLADSMERTLQKKHGYRVDTSRQSFISALSLREINLGSKASVETRKKMSANRHGPDNSFYGKKHKDSTKQLMSSNHYDCTGGKNPAAKSVIILGKHYETIKSALLSGDTPFKGMPAITRRLYDPNNLDYKFV